MAGKKQDNWELGVVLGLLGSVAINTGNNIQSLGLKKLKKKRLISKISEKRINKKRQKWLPLTSKKNMKIVPCEHSTKEQESIIIQNAGPSTSKTWVIGTVIFITGSLLNFSSFAFAPQSMLASLESIQFVTNLIFGRFMLGADVTKTMLLGTCLTVAGTVLAVQFSSKSTLELSTREMINLYYNPIFIAYMVMVIGLLFLLNFVYRFYEKRKKTGKELKYTDILMPLSYSIWSALFGTQSVVQAKVFSKLIAVQSSEDESLFSSWFTYFTLLYWIITVCVWLKKLNDALSKFDPLFIIPLLQCSFIFFAIVSGGIFFKEFNGFTFRQWVGFWSGIMIMFSGLILLTPKNRPIKRQSVLIRKEIDDLLLENDCTKLDESNENMNGIYNEATHNTDNHREKKIASEKKETIIPVGPSLSSQILDSSNSVDLNNPRRQKRIERRSFTDAAIAAVKDAMVESAKGVESFSSMLISPHNSTGAHTDAMMVATQAKEGKDVFMVKVKHLRVYLNGMGNKEVEEMYKEVQGVVQELGLQQTICDEYKRNKALSSCEFKLLMLKKTYQIEEDLNGSLGTLGEVDVSYFK